MDTVHGAAVLIGIETADKGHMEVAGCPALVGHRSVAGDVANRRVIQHAGDHSDAVRDAGSDCQGAAFIDDEVLDHSTLAEVAEEAEMRAHGAYRITELEVFDPVGIAVEAAEEGRA